MEALYEGIDFLGNGWAFPVTGSASGEINMSAEETKITESIWIILATAPGERVMRPDFGCGIHRLIFAPRTSTVMGRASDMVRDALIRWETRIEVLDVTAEARGHGELLLINVRYLVRTTNNLFNMVYPFYLRGTAGE